MKMLQEYWASTVIFIGIFSQCIHKTRSYKKGLYPLKVHRVEKKIVCWKVRTIWCLRNYFSSKEAFLVPFIRL